MHCKQYGHIRTWHIYNTGKTLYIVEELLLQSENNQQTMPNNEETQHKHMYSLYIGSLCALPMARITCTGIRENQSNEA